MGRGEIKAVGSNYFIRSRNTSCISWPSEWVPEDVAPDVTVNGAVCLVVGRRRLVEEAEEAAADREEAVAGDADRGGAPVDQGSKEHAAEIPNAAAIGLHHVPRVLEDPHRPEHLAGH